MTNGKPESREERAERRQGRFIYKSFLGVALLSALCSLTCDAADLQISARLDRQQMSMNDQAVLSVTVSGGASNLPDPEMPDLPQFQVYNAGRAQSVSWVNGQTSASVTHSYVLSPKQEGHFSIPPIHVSGGGQSAQTPPLAIDVVKGNASAIAAPPSSGGSDARGRSRGSAPAFIMEVPDKSSVYVGEPVTVSFRFYTRVPLLSQPQYQPPQTTGFWTEDLPPQRSYNTTYHGVPYSVVEVKTALFPTASGQAHVGPATVALRLQSMAQDPFSGDFFANFFGQGEEKVLHTEPLDIRVKPLPDPKPAGFKGAVGRYSVSAAVDKSSVETGQPLTLTVTISGTGNIKSIPDLDWPALTNFRTFDASAATNIEKKDYRVQGSKVFRTVLIPTASGRTTIPAIPFVYFDPEQRVYKTVHSREITFDVKQGANTGTTTTMPGVAGSANAPGIHVLNEDIRYIRTPATLQPPATPLDRRPFYWVLNGLCGLALLGSFLLPLYRRVFLSDERRLRFRGAMTAAAGELKAAEDAIGRQDPRAAGLLNGALQTFLAAKLGRSGVSRRDVLADLQTRGASGHTLEKVRHWWETLDLYQFSPAQVRPDDLQKAAQALKQLMGELDELIAWKK